MKAFVHFLIMFSLFLPGWVFIGWFSATVIGVKSASWWMAVGYLVAIFYYPLCRYIADLIVKEVERA